MVQHPEKVADFHQVAAAAKIQAALAVKALKVKGSKVVALKAQASRAMAVKPPGEGYPIALLLFLGCCC